VKVEDSLFLKLLKKSDSIFLITVIKSKPEESLISLLWKKLLLLFKEPAKKSSKKLLIKWLKIMSSLNMKAKTGKGTSLDQEQEYIYRHENINHINNIL